LVSITQQDLPLFFEFLNFGFPCSLYCAGLLILFVFLRPEHNVLEAATLGATATIKLVSYIVANIISCLAAIQMFNWILNYLGGLVGLDGLSFEVR
jgi:Na+ dependent nucleoside transporter C-terminus